MSQQDKNTLVARTIDEFGLQRDTPNQMEAEFTTMTLAFDPLTYQSNIRIRILRPEDLSLTGDAVHHISISGSMIDPHTFEVMPPGPLALAGEPTLEEKDVSGLPPQYFLNIPVQGAMEWGLVHVEEGAIKSKSQGDEVGYFLIVKGPYGLKHLMSMRALPLDDQGMAIMTPGAYGAPEPVSLPEVPQDQLETVMRQNLQRALTKAVSHGDITQQEAEALLGKFDDTQLAAAVKDPAMRAAVLVGASLKSAGGDLILPLLLGQNSRNTTLRMFVDGDPELDVLFQGKTHPTIDPNGGIVWLFDDGTMIFIAGRNLKDGKEPIEVLASLMPHEILAHEADKDSIGEETLGNLLEAVAWAQLIQRDPGLITRGTYMTQFNNLLLYALLNSLYVDEKAQPPLDSHVGLTSRITGEQTHNQADFNVLPDNHVQPVKSFYDLIKLFYQNASERGVKMDPTSPGTENTLQLFKTLFGADVVIPDRLGHKGTTGEIVPDFSELLLTDFMDARVQQLIPDEAFKELAQALHMTLDASASQ